MKSKLNLIIVLILLLSFRCKESRTQLQKLKIRTMKQIKLILSVLLLSTAMTSYGQTTSNSQDEIAIIEVIGNAEKEVVPDEIYIAIIIRERESGKDKITIEKQVADLKEALKSLGVSLDNLSLSDADANYVRIKWSKKDVITKTKYMLKVSDALMVGKVFEKLDELKITDSGIARVGHSKLEDYKKEVRIMAIKAAKDKADYLLEAIGEETGKAIMVNEKDLRNRLDGADLNVRGSRNEANNYYIDGIKSKSMDSDKTIQFQKIKLQSSIYVKFKIK